MIEKRFKRQRGIIPILVLAAVCIVIFAGTAAFSAGIAGDFQGVGGLSGSGETSGGIMPAGDDGCYLDTTLDLSTALVQNYQGEVTGYYSPRPGQAKYNMGNYADEKRMNAPNDPRTASGIDVARGAIAVDPRVFPFGTVFDIPGYGKGIAVDTGGGVHTTHLDAWSGIGDAGLMAAKTIGMKVRTFKAYSWPNLSKDELRKAIRRVCGNGMASSGKGCPAVAQNAVDIGSRLQKKNFGTYDYLPGVTNPNYGRPGRYWCTNLVIDSYHKSGFNKPPSGMLDASVMGNWFKQNGTFFANGSGTPKPGDFILMEQRNNYVLQGSGNHVGIVTEVGSNYIKTSEANTMGKNPKTYHIQDGKYFRSPKYGVILGFGRLKNCN